MRVLFMGTPEFAVPSLDILIKKGYEVVGVVTQIDRPRDRGHALKAPPVKEFALAHNLPVFQPNKLSKEPETIENLKKLKPDVIVTCAFGQILPKSVLDIPRMGTVNVHGSLLPKYRGAAPIQWAIINGDKKTGITTMLTDVGLDTGDMLLKDVVEITDNMTAGELHDIMSVQGAKTLARTLEALGNGSVKPEKQDESEATYAPKIDRSTGWVDWAKSTASIHNLIRGVTPWPGAFTEFNEERVRLWRSDITKSFDSQSTSGEPGTLLRVDDEGMWVKTLDGALLIKEVQFGSRKRMTPKQYSCGHEFKAGMKFKSHIKE